MSKKTKELLDNLNKITEKPQSKFQRDNFHSYTNMFYTSMPESIHKLPKRYDKAKRKKDEDGDEYIMIDRIYGSIFVGGLKLQQADGTRYTGKLTRKRRLIKLKDPITKEDKSFYSRCTVTDDGRWFDNAGMPIEAPEKLEPEKQKSKEEIEEEQQEKADIAKRKEAEILANLK
tara:strand:+ start:1633 stop:2154 length:522 start_codon:yes stop_codon:yes gene_type:complete